MLFFCRLFNGYGHEMQRLFRIFTRSKQKYNILGLLKPNLGIYLICTILLCLAGCSESNKDEQSLFDKSLEGATYIKEVKEGAFQFIRNGKPHYVKGACSAKNVALLHRIGANSIRTYGMDDALTTLDSAQKYEMSVTLTLWLHHTDYFDYSDSNVCKQLFKLIELQVNRYKKHPALLAWCIGNEFQWNQKPDIAAYKFLNKVSRRIHELDPNHPTTTAVPGYPRFHIPVITRYCSDLDFISFNKFGQINSIQEKRKDVVWGYDGPYLISEFGNYGYWDPYLDRMWNMTVEPSDSVKSQRFISIFKEMKEDKSLLGSYSFYFGNKQEYTHTWFSLLGPQGEKTQMIEAINDYWEGKPFHNLAPRIHSFSLNGIDSNEVIHTESSYSVDLKVSDPESDSLRYEFEWIPEKRIRKNLIDKELKPTSLNVTFTTQRSDLGLELTFTAPKYEGPMRLFVHVRDGKNNIASANLPLFVQQIKQP